MSVEKLSHLSGVEKAAQAMTPSWQVGTQRQGGHLATVRRAFFGEDWSLYGPF